MEYNRALEVLEVISEAVERLLLKCFRWETRLRRFSNELQEATFEDLDHVTICREFEVKSDVTSLLVVTFSIVKYFLF